MHAGPQSFKWLYMTPTPVPVDVKSESSPQELSLPLSPTSSAPTICSASNTHLARSPSPSRRGSPSHPSIASPKRVKPYTSLLREQRLQGQGAGTMANSSYGTWPSSVIKGGYGKSNIPGERRGSYPDQQSSSTLSHAYEFHSFIGGSSDRSNHRPHSSNSTMTTSSLTGAVGDPHDSRHFNHSNSPSPEGEHAYDVNMQSSLLWSSNQTPSMAVDALQVPYTEVAEQGTRDVPYHTVSQQSGSMRSVSEPYGQYDYGSTYQNPSPESLSSPSPSPAFSSSHYTEQLPFQQPPSAPTGFSRPNTHYSGESTPAPSPPPPAQAQLALEKETLEHENWLLRKKVRDLELINESAQTRVSELEGQAAVNRDLSSRPTQSVVGGMPPQSATFKASWKARTEARIKQFCSLNRAGNALCAWHDSRRERRIYPPRMAPTGHLNCGCTHEEALFEESLARHHVGSYYPGETVRMDPALRNPLLKLLQSRYGYKDGDFERDQTTGGWVEGEGHAYWESMIQSGTVSHRRARAEYERH